MSSKSFVKAKKTNILCKSTKKIWLIQEKVVLLHRNP